VETVLLWNPVEESVEKNGEKLSYRHKILSLPVNITS